MSEQTFNTALENINTHLIQDGYLVITTLSKEEILKRKKSGCLSNSYYKIEFKESECNEIYGNTYYYSLVDSVDRCVEYLADLDELENKLAVYGILLVEKFSFKNFKNIEKYQQSAFSYKKNAIEELTPEEEEVFDLHIAIVFQKQKII